jgi:hypothetical protein
MSTKPARNLHALLAAIVLASGAAFATDKDNSHYVLREYTIPLDDIDEIELHASVGSVEILPHDANEVRLVLEIEGQRSGWLRRRHDVSNIELEHDVRGHRLVLRQTEEDTKTEWTVRMPAVARTTLNLGVGEIDADLGATKLLVKLGVGDADVTLPAASTGEVDIDVGVGNANLRGANSVDGKRAIVSETVRGHGNGALDARVKVGVGDASVWLK